MHYLLETNLDQGINFSNIQGQSLGHFGFLGVTSRITIISPAYRAILLFCYYLIVKTFLIIFAVLEIVALVYAAWYHLKGKDIDQKKDSI